MALWQRVGGTRSYKMPKDSDQKLGHSALECFAAYHLQRLLHTRPVGGSRGAEKLRI